MVRVSKITALGSVTLPINSWMTGGMFCLAFKIPEGGIKEVIPFNLSCTVVPSIVEPPRFIIPSIIPLASASIISLLWPLWELLFNKSSIHVRARAVTAFDGRQLLSKIWYEVVKYLPRPSLIIFLTPASSTYLLNTLLSSSIWPLICFTNGDKEMSKFLSATLSPPKASTTFFQYCSTFKVPPRPTILLPIPTSASL